MNIALFGYGKMGKMLEQIAMQRGHTIVAKIDAESTTVSFKNVDVAIDFSMPSAAFKNISLCFEHQVPVVSGTTGWLSDYDKAIDLCKQKDGAFIYASNFSLGVNVFFELNDHLAKMMKNLETYDVALEEIHHTQKLDAPSGTAITLAEGILRHSKKETWSLDKKEDNKIPIFSKREGKVPGTHTISYASKVDQIDIRHTAHNREGFALGAIIAAEWLQDKTGVFSMKDVLNMG